MLKPENDSNKNKYAILAGAFCALAFHFKISALLIPLSLFIFAVIKERLSILKKKEYWLFLGSYALVMLPYFIWAYFTFGNPLAFTTGYSANVGTPAPFAWHVLSFFSIFGLRVLYYSFIFGLILCLRVLLYSDIILKDKERAFDPRLLLLITILVTICFYIFYIKGVEDRWVFILIPLMCSIAAMFIYFVAEKIGKYYKWAAVLFVLVMLGFSGYEQFNLGKQNIEVKELTYFQVKEAAEWIKANSNPNEITMSISYPQMLYYSDRPITSFSGMNQSEFERYLQENHPVYLMLSRYEPHPPWSYYWVINETTSVPVWAAYFDDAKTQPAVVIYRLLY